MFLRLREYAKKADAYYSAQFATEEGARRVWITLIIGTIIGDIVILGPLLADYLH